MNYSIVPMSEAMWPAVREIYAEGIATGNATFETELPNWEKWDDGHRKECRVVALDASASKSVLGWAALSPVSGRRVYAGVCEVSVYVATRARGRGLGKLLLQALVNNSEAQGIWTLQAGIFPENLASVGLHEACGFRKVGVRQRLGMLGNKWRDVLLLERRSLKVGV